MKRLVGRDIYNDVEYMIEIDDDGSHWLLTRPGYRATDVSWSAPVALEPHSAEISS